MHVTETRYLYSFHLLQITIFRMDEDGIDIDIAILKALLKGLFRGRPLRYKNDIGRIGIGVRLS